MEELKMESLTDNPSLATVKRVVEPEDRLRIQVHQRIICQYTSNSSDKELILYYEDKEIVFDDPEFFTFGENLAEQKDFIAGDTLNWGHGFSWSKVFPLLQSLLDEGILSYSADLDNDAMHLPNGFQPNPLAKAATNKSYTWNDCETITKSLVGKKVELAYLEMIIPIFRVIHICLDAEDRQVGEANVFPPKLRLDIPTTWRTCPHSGSRYRSDNPMNVTALKSMRQYWKPIMCLLRIIRQKYLQRFPGADKNWTVAHMERLATVVLVLPTYMMMRKHNRIENGDLHPALSCMFRVTDGLRLTLHQMLFLPLVEKVLQPDEVMTGPKLYEYVERNYSFYSENGVCAGPKAMIDEFLQVMFDGVDNGLFREQDLDDSLKHELTEINQVLDYGFYGLKAYSIIFSLWPKMARTYEEIWTLIKEWDQTNPIVKNFVTRFSNNIRNLRSGSLLANEELRQDRERVYEDMFKKSCQGLNQDIKILQQAIAPQTTNQQRKALDKLYRLLKEKCLGKDKSKNHGQIAALATSIMSYLRVEQGIVKAACQNQIKINSLLDRAPPKELFAAADFDIYNQLLGKTNSLPYLAAELEDILNISIRVDKNNIEING